MELENPFLQMLMKQIQYLEEQNKNLMQQNKELTDKVFSLLNENNIIHLNENSANNKPKIAFYTNLSVTTTWFGLVENIKKYVTLEDIKFYEKGYVDAVFDTILRILNMINDNRPIYTFSKKNKIMVIYKSSKWEKIAFEDFKNEVKIITNKIIHAMFCNFKKKISTDVYDETVMIMMDDTDKYKEAIANKLLDYCVYLE